MIILVKHTGIITERLYSMRNRVVSSKRIAMWIRLRTTIPTNNMIIIVVRISITVKISLLILDTTMLWHHLLWIFSAFACVDYLTVGVLLVLLTLLFLWLVSYRWRRIQLIDVYHLLKREIIWGDILFFGVCFLFFYIGKQKIFVYTQSQ